MALSNYEVMRNQMRNEFIKYNAEKMIEKFHLSHDASYLYIDFVLHTYRIGRDTGIVEWSDDDFSTIHEADYNESMTIYDVLCYSKDGCFLTGRYCPVNMLKGTVQTSLSTGSFFKRSAGEFSGKLKELKEACLRFGEPLSMKGDVAVKLYPFSFLPITLQYWDADEEFPANLKFMFDENILQYMHYETTYFMVGHILKRIREMMETEKFE